MFDNESDLRLIMYVFAGQRGKATIPDILEFMSDMERKVSERLVLEKLAPFMNKGWIVRNGTGYKVI